jgi:thiazole synthase
MRRCAHCRSAREIGGWTLVKLEVISGNKNLYPDVYQTLEAAKRLTKDGFQVMAYTTE